MQVSRLWMSYHSTKIRGRGCCSPRDGNGAGAQVPARLPGETPQTKGMPKGAAASMFGKKPLE